MVEQNRLQIFLSHAVLILAIIVLAFPIYVVFVASSVSLPTVMQAPMTLLPGRLLIENYTQALFEGAAFGG